MRTNAVSLFIREEWSKDKKAEQCEYTILEKIFNHKRFENFSSENSLIFQVKNLHSICFILE
jgi:hypothetical protein